jgi:hypothetical protein
VGDAGVPIHSVATSCATLMMPRWKEARRRLPARPSIRKSIGSIVCTPSAFSILTPFPVRAVPCLIWSSKRVWAFTPALSSGGEVSRSPEVDQVPPAVVS